MRQRVEATGLPIFTVAPAAGIGVTSLNDQLVQGMKAARLALASAARTVPQADGADATSAAAAATRDWSTQRGAASVLRAIDTLTAVRATTSPMTLPTALSA